MYGYKGETLWSHPSSSPGFRWLVTSTLHHWCPEILSENPSQAWWFLFLVLLKLIYNLDRAQRLDQLARGSIQTVSALPTCVRAKNESWMESDIGLRIENWERTECLMRAEWQAGTQRYLGEQEAMPVYSEKWALILTKLFGRSEGIPPPPPLLMSLLRGTVSWKTFSWKHPICQSLPTMNCLSN